MKLSTKFFLLAIAVNILLSAVAVWTSLLREMRLVDLVLFYATAFGAGASFAAFIITLRREKAAQIAKGEVPPPQESSVGTG